MNEQTKLDHKKVKLFIDNEEIINFNEMSFPLEVKPNKTRLSKILWYLNPKKKKHFLDYLDAMYGHSINTLDNMILMFEPVNLEKVKKLCPIKLSDKQFNKWINEWKGKFRITWQPIPDYRCAPDGKVVKFRWEKN